MPESRSSATEYTVGQFTGSEPEEGASDAEYDGQNEIRGKQGNSESQKVTQRDSWMTANEPTGRNILTGEIREPAIEEKAAKDGDLPKHKVQHLFTTSRPCSLNSSHNSPIFNSPRRW